jgi:hypothetical protein
MKPVYTLAGRFFRLLGNLPISTQKQLSAVMLVRCVGGKLRLNVTCHCMSGVPVETLQWRVIALRLALRDNTVAKLRLKFVHAAMSRSTARGFLASTYV